jgi:hypothetical protein
MIYKVDIDITKNRTLDKYLKWLEFALIRLSEGGKQFREATVFSTRHGYHIYFKDNTKQNPYYVSLIECLLGSDVNKQLYFFAEKADILFKVKNGYAEVPVPVLSRRITRMINKASKWRGYTRIDI